MSMLALIQIERTTVSPYYVDETLPRKVLPPTKEIARRVKIFRQRIRFRLRSLYSIPVTRLPAKAKFTE